MLAVSQTAGYALMAMSQFDETTERWVQAVDVSRETGIPRPYLMKILGRLQSADLVIARRGAGGGLKLARPAAEISMSDVISALDSPDWNQRCVLGLPVCSGDNPCPMHDYWGVVRQELLGRLESLKLTDIMEFARNGWRLPVPADKGGEDGKVILPLPASSGVS